jgi:hypothetical protein
MLELLYDHLNGHGKAIVSYAKLLSRRHRVDMREALSVARDVLSSEDEATCETLVVLIADGWDATLGEVVAAARKV